MLSLRRKGCYRLVRKRVQKCNPTCIEFRLALVLQGIAALNPSSSPSIGNWLGDALGEHQQSDNSGRTKCMFLSFAWIWWEFIHPNQAPSRGAQDCWMVIRCALKAKYAEAHPSVPKAINSGSKVASVRAGMTGWLQWTLVTTGRDRNGVQGLVWDYTTPRIGINATQLRIWFKNSIEGWGEG